jgi:hypothetical protein
MLEELRKEVAEKEEIIKIQLAREIQSLQEEKLKIENDIRGIYSTLLFFFCSPWIRLISVQLDSHLLNGLTVVIHPFGV